MMDMLIGPATFNENDENSLEGNMIFFVYITNIIPAHSS